MQLDCLHFKCDTYLMHSSTWQLQEAESRFAELIELARSEGAQTITMDGKPMVLVIRADDSEKRKPGKTLLEHLRSCPEPGLEELIGTRSQEASRTIELG